ncbi:hypothetical protein BD410DRAFT_88377 [Rickenella mellea]|uniref:Mid2 domain-containing protein n=1 Tax=Rickenella mellea TaxID=50990 RepID=A0A4Y7QBH6_9AGAM|nr:hypothetical protein BD410DRAFT_88377 [Rickenella mellea]
MSLSSPINFLPLAPIVPCQPYTFTFTYTETDERHVEGETNMFTAGVFNASTGANMLTLTNGGAVYPGYWQFDWNPVKASAGVYYITASVVSTSNVTYKPMLQPFTIEAGSDESCINAAVTEAPISLVLSSGATVAPVTVTGFAAPSSTSIVEAGSSTGRRTGAIAGLTIGIIAILFGLLAAILFVRRRRAARAQKAQVPELPTYVPELPAYAAVVPVMTEKEKDTDRKSAIGPLSDYDRESLRSVPPSYHLGDV